MRLECNSEDSKIICDALNKIFHFNYDHIYFIDSCRELNGTYYKVYGREISDYYSRSKFDYGTLYVHNHEFYYKDINEWFLQKSRDLKIKELGI